MMDFHLQFPVIPFDSKIAYGQPMLFIGSCFAENIGEKMQELKFNAAINPHGILYNPHSISVALRSYISNVQLGESDLFFFNECWHSPQHHSRFSHPDKLVCLSAINGEITKAHEQLKKVEWLFITFGAAFVYTHIASNRRVGNCHKLPQKEFEKSLLSATEIISGYDQLIEELKNFNPRLKIVLTVSPVRYIRDGVVENNRSKAILLQSVHELVEKHDHVFYFPAYELIIDDLRDYRFYKPDLVHPNEQAIAYVFEKLMDCGFSAETRSLSAKIGELINARNHRPQHSDTAAFQKFKASHRKRAVELQRQFGFLDLRDEINYFSCGSPR